MLVRLSQSGARSRCECFWSDRFPFLEVIADGETLAMVDGRRRAVDGGDGRTDGKKMQDMLALEMICTPLLTVRVRRVVS